MANENDILLRPPLVGTGVTRLKLSDRSKDKPQEIRASSRRLLLFEQALTARTTQFTAKVAEAITLAVAADLFAATAHDSDRDVKEGCADFLKQRLGKAPAAVEKHLPGEIPLPLEPAG